MRLITLLIFLIFLSACRFKSPTIAEQAELARMGAFPAGIPAWTSSIPQLSAFPMKDTGFIPLIFRGSRVVDNSAPQGSYTERSVQVAMASLIDSTSGEVDDGEKSPLDRIAVICPGLDKEAEKALLIENRSERIKKYERLTAKCPGNSDIWLWLAKDYKRNGQSEKARSAALRALSIDASNKEAAELIDSL